MNMQLKLRKVKAAAPTPKSEKMSVWFGWFYGISTFVGYLMPNPFLCK